MKDLKLIRKMRQHFVYYTKQSNQHILDLLWYSAESLHYAKDKSQSVDGHNRSRGHSDHVSDASLSPSSRCYYCFKARYSFISASGSSWSVHRAVSMAVQDLIEHFAPDCSIKRLPIDVVIERCVYRKAYDC